MKITVVLAALAFVFARASFADAATTLTLAGYHASALTGAVPGSRRFAVSVHGAPSEHVHVTAVGVPTGYLASFCTPLVCAPFAVPITLPASGTAVVELQIVKNDAAAVAPRTVTVRSNDGARASIAYRMGTR